MPAPEVSVNLTVVIECQGPPTRIKYLKLHRETVATLMPPLDSLCGKLTARKEQINEVANQHHKSFFIASLVAQLFLLQLLDVTALAANKQLGPIFAFVSEIDDAEIKLEELQPHFVA